MITLSKYVVYNKKGEIIAKKQYFEQFKNEKEVAEFRKKVLKRYIGADTIDFKDINRGK